MKFFRGLNRKQKLLLLIAGGVIIVAIIAGTALLLRGNDQVVLNSEQTGVVPEPEAGAPLAPIGDSRADKAQSVVIYCADANYQSLSATVRDIKVTSDTTLEEAVVKAVLETPSGNGVGALGASDIQLLSLELSRGVATVDLSIDARRLEPERLHMLRAAIVNSLLELKSVKFVNVLIDDREECIIQLPAGTMSRFDNNLQAVWLAAQTEDNKFENAKVGGYVLSRDVTLYFGAPGGKYILPEVRAVRIEDADYLGAIIAQLFKGPSDTQNYERLLPSGDELLREKPEIVAAADGSKIAVLSFNGELTDYLKRNSISTELAFGSLTRSICGFVPEVEGALCDIDGIMVNELYDSDGNLSMSFDDGIMRRSDFDSLVGEEATLYYQSADGATLTPVNTALSRYEVTSPRALLNKLMEKPYYAGAADAPECAIPSSVTDADVLGVRVEESDVLINLSSAFYQACQNMSAQDARAMVYSIVDTMCGISGINSVRFYFDGERVDYLAGAICLRGPLIENVGMVRG